MSLHRFSLERLEISLSQLDKSLHLIGVNINPNHDTFSGMIRNERLRDRSIKIIFKEIYKLFDFNDPVNLFAVRHMPAVDDIIRTNITPLQDSRWPLRTSLQGVSYSFFDREKGMAYKQYQLFIFIVMSRIQFFFASKGIDVDLANRTDSSPEIILSALVFFVYESGPAIHRIYNEDEKEAVVSGFIAFTKSLLLYDDVYRVIMNHPDGLLFYSRLRKGLLSNGYDHTVTMLDNDMNEKYPPVHSDRKRKTTRV